MEAGGARVPCPSVDVKGACGQGPGGQALSPEVGSLEDSVCPSELLMTCESSKASRPIFLVLQSTPLIFQEPCEQLASIYGAATERPVVKANLPPWPLPHFPYGSAVLYCAFAHHRYWKQEVDRAEENGEKPSLKKAIIKCYWKSCLLSSIFIFFEVKAFINSALLSLYMGQY